jgi:hypothetical protein
LPSAALGKAVFAECPRKGTRQSGRHSAKSRIPVVRTPEAENGGGTKKGTNETS